MTRYRPDDGLTDAMRQEVRAELRRGRPYDDIMDCIKQTGSVRPPRDGVRVDVNGPQSANPSVQAAVAREIRETAESRLRETVARANQPASYLQAPEHYKGLHVRRVGGRGDWAVYWGNNVLSGTMPKDEAFETQSNLMLLPEHQIPRTRPAFLALVARRAREIEDEARARVLHPFADKGRKLDL